VDGAIRVSSGARGACARRDISTSSPPDVIVGCPLLQKPQQRDLLLEVLERVRLRYHFAVVGPEI
jgi:hypothetical protein